MKAVSAWVFFLIVWGMFLFGVGWVCHNSPLAASLIIDALCVVCLITMIGSNKNE